MSTKGSHNLIPIRSRDEIPEFHSEKDEADYWATHSLDDELLAEMDHLDQDVLPSSRPRTRPVSLRFDEETLNRAKALAQVKHIGYQTLLKRFILERLYEEEKREGLMESGPSRQ